MPFFKTSLILICLLSTASLFSYQEEGIASWYGGKFQGRKTANGEVFDTNELTAAHKTLPFGTLVMVENLDNGKTVILRINDRGPYVGDRIIDLSRKGAETLNMIESGTARVRITSIDPDTREIRFADPITCTIQLASYTDLMNAQNMKKRLQEEGFQPVARLNNRGMTTLYLERVPLEECYDTVKKLERIPLTGIILRQDRELPSP